MCLEFVPAGVSCLCPYDKMLPIGPVNLTHTHLEFVPAGVSCLCHYDDMLPIGPDNLTHTHTQVCAFQGDNTVQLQDALRAGSLPGLQRAVSSIVTQRTQARLMQTYKDILAVDISREQAEVNLSRLHSLQSGVGTAWMDVLPTKETWELDDATVTVSYTHLTLPTILLV